MSNISEEEKETIKYIESGIDTYIENTKVTKIVISEEQAKILLNLIEKLEKELEQEKEKNKELEKYTIHLTDKQYRDVVDLAQKEIYDKIREKIEWLDKLELLGKVDFSRIKFATDILKKLLKEEQ